MAFLRSADLRSLSMALALVGTAACVEPSGFRHTEVVAPSYVDVEFQGHFDGHELVLAPLDSEDRGEGVAAEALLDTLDAGQFGSTATATGSDFVALEQVAGSLATRVNGVGSNAPWEATRCGPVPTTGTCVQIRMRNLFPDRVITHAHFELTELDAVQSTTLVYVPAPTEANDSSPSDSVLGIGGVRGGLWRFGAVEPATPPGEGPVVSWTFLGATPPGTSFRYVFRGRVRAHLVDPTVRASVVSGTSDRPPTYGSGGSSDGSVAGRVGISADGRYVVFASDATNLVPGTSTAVQRVYRADLETATVELASTGPNLAIPASCRSGSPSISADGQVVAFESDCPFVANDMNGVSDVYVRRLGAEVGTILASRSGSGAVRPQPSGDPDISPDGQFVVFVSQADLASYRPAGRTLGDIYRRNVSGLSVPHNQIVPVTRYWSGGYQWLDGDSRSPRIAVSGSTTVIVFESDATDAGSSDGDGNGVTDVFAYVVGLQADSAASRPRVSVTATGGELDGASTQPTVSHAGPIIAVTSVAPNAFGTSGASHIYVRTRGSAATLQLADRTPSGAVSAGGASHPNLASSRWLVFRSSAADLTDTPVSGPQIYVRDRSATQAGYRRAFATSLDFDLQAASVDVTFPAISHDARYLVFVGGAGLVGAGRGDQAYRAPLVDPSEQ